MGVVIEICVKYPRGPTPMKGTDIYIYICSIHFQTDASARSSVTCNGYVTAVAVGQSQPPYSGLGIFNWYYLNSPPQIPRPSEVDLE